MKHTTPAALALLVLSTLALSFRAPPALAQDESAQPVPQATEEEKPAGAPSLRLVYNNLLVLRWNPLGFEDQIRFGLQKRLYVSDSALFKDNFVHLGIYPKLNPAFIKAGPSVEIQPLSIFNLRLAAEGIGFFSTFGYLQSFPSPIEDYSDTAMDAADAAGENYSTRGLHAMVEPGFQMKVGSVAVRDKFAYEYWRMDVEEGDTVWYDATLDTLVPANGFVLANDADILLFVPKTHLVVGSRYSIVRPLYDGDAFRSADEQALFDADQDLDRTALTDGAGYYGNAHQRLGLILAYTFYDRGYTRFNKPSVLLISSWYLNHRWRAGQDVSQAMPYVVAAFSFQSDLL